MKTLKKLSITKKISFTVFGILCFTLSIYLVIFFLSNDSKVNQRIIDENEQLSLMLTESIKLAMAEGADDTTPFVQSFEKFKKIKDVRITPTAKIDEKSVLDLDEMEKKALTNNIESNYFEEFEKSRVLRSIKFLKSDNTCTECHDVENGDILAVISIRQSLDATYSEMASQKIDAAWIGLLAAIITFALVAYFVNRNLGKPIVQLTNAVQSFSKGKFEKIKVKSEDELGVLANSFNDMSKQIKTQLQYLDNLPTPIMVVDNDFNIQYMNKKGAEVLGQEQQSLKGKKCYDHFKTGDCNTDKCACSQAMKRDQIVIEETLARPNGANLPVMYTGAPIKDEDGNIIGAIEYFADISELKNREDYLKRSTNIILGAMDKFSNGDLTVSVISENSSDEIGKLFNGFNQSVGKIKKAMSQVVESIQATASATNHISATAEELAAGSQEQSAQTSEVATAVEQMLATITQTAQNVSRTNVAALESGNYAKEGQKVIEDTIVGMKNIDKVVTHSSEIIKELGESSGQIGAIIQVINEIAEQTNLLALNAAIEAARAGEQGRGFAVVADEVRKLAERTTSATNEIEGMVKKIQNDSNNAVKAISQGNDEVSRGMQKAAMAGESMQNIVKSADEVEELSTQVATASEEQSVTMEQISKSIEGINTVTHEASASVQQVASASIDLLQLTENLQSMVLQFKIVEDENSDYESSYKAKNNRVLV